jgi:hypothetical protein
MSLINRFLGIFFNPRETFRFLSEKPVWLDALVILLIAVVVFTYIVGPYIQQDELKRLEQNTKLRERIGEDAYNQRLEFMRNPPKFMLILSLVLQPISVLIGLLLSSLIILGLGRLTSTEGKYTQIFSAFIHANFINLVLGNALRILLAVSKKSVYQTTTSAAIFFPNLEVTSPAYIVLSQFDLFQIWLFGVLAFGLSHILKIELKKSLFISYGFLLIKIILSITLGLLRAKTLG